MNDFGQILWLIVPAFVGIITYYWLKWSRVFRYWKSRGIPTPLPLPLLGTTFETFFKRRPEVDLKWSNTLGKIYGFYMFERPHLTVAEPLLIKQILVKDFNLFRNRSYGSKKFTSLLTARDDEWKRVRSITSPTFTSGKLKRMYSLINKCCNDFLEDLEEKVGKQTDFELNKLMGTYTLDVIARCAFATNTNTYKDPNNEFLIRGMKILDIDLWKQIILMTFPNFLLQRIRGYLVNTENRDFFMNFSKKLIKDRRNSPKIHNDFLQILMDVERTDKDVSEETDANEAHHLNEGNEELKANAEALKNVSEKKLTENEILGNCFIFLVAGFESTATVLSYCIYELALNPVLQERLYDEVRDAFDESGEVKYEVLSQLPFLDAVISESLRKYPPFLRAEREAMENVLLGDSGIEIEKGVVVEIPIYAIHHDANNFADPHTFNPDRFMPENRDKIKPYTYIPFGAGPRHCIGMRFALLSAKLGLSRISRKFKFSRVESTDVPVVFKKGKGLLQPQRLIIGIEKR